MDDGFHDNLIHGLHLRPAEPDAGDWRHELWLDIDHIAEWVCGTDGGARFRVAPANLVFHDVTALRIAADFGASGRQDTVSALSIDGITRTPWRLESAIEPVEYYRWRIALNDPQGGEISFGAKRYTLAHRAAPVLQDRQSLPGSARAPMLRD